MARRGRFTSPNSGGQNLTALIASLLRERNSAEEQALLNAYRTGTAYNGSVPTADSIQDFYNSWASNAGYAPGTLEYQAIVQKKSDLNNYDLKKQFNVLISEFNTTDGSNYQEIINFVTGAAQTSTDPDDIADYGNAIESTTSAYLKYQGQRLVRGELTAAEYQRITLEAISVLDPESTAYTNAVYDAYQYEWNAESSKWSNRIKAGTGTNAQFRSWANGFKNRIASAGVSTDSDLYTAIGATIAQTNMAVGDSPTNTRLSTTINDLNTVFNIASNVVGGLKLNMGDIIGDPKDILKKLKDNPAMIGLLADALDDNPSLISPTLTALGITSGASLLSWYNGKVSSGLNDAETIANAGGSSDYDDWIGVAKTSGSLTAMDEYAVAASKRARLIDQAAGNPTLITYYNSEYEKFLTGKDSFFGTVPSDQGLFDEQVIVINNEYNALTGNADGSPTLSGYQGGQEPVWEDVQGYAIDSEDIKNGRAVLEWRPELGKKGEYVAADLKAKGYRAGSYQYVSFTVLPNGTKTSHIVSVVGKQIVNGNNEPNGWLYQGPNGNFAVDLQGNSYRVTQPIPTKPEGYEVDDFNKVGTKEDSIPLIDLTPFNNPRAASADNPSIVMDGVSPAEMREAANLAGLVSSGLDKDSSDAFNSQIATLNTKANEQEATTLGTNPTIENLLKAAKLRGSNAANDYENVVLKNPTMYREAEPGLFYKQDTNTGDFINDLIFGLDFAGNILYPMTVDLRTPQMIKAKEEKNPSFWEVFGGELNTALPTNNPIFPFFSNLIFGESKKKETDLFKPVGLTLPGAVPLYPPRASRLPTLVRLTPGCPTVVLLGCVR
jgi:hypothetical protein